MKPLLLLLSLLISVNCLTQTDFNIGVLNLNDDVPEDGFNQHAIRAEDGYYVSGFSASDLETVSYIYFFDGTTTTILHEEIENSRRERGIRLHGVIPTGVIYSLQQYNNSGYPLFLLSPDGTVTRLGKIGWRELASVQVLGDKVMFQTDAGPYVSDGTPEGTMQLSDPSASREVLRPYDRKIIQDDSGNWLFANIGGVYETGRALTTGVALYRGLTNHFTPLTKHNGSLYFSSRHDIFRYDPEQGLLPSHEGNHPLDILAYITSTPHGLLLTGRHQELGKQAFTLTEAGELIQLTTADNGFSDGIKLPLITRPERMAVGPKMLLFATPDGQPAYSDGTVAGTGLLPGIDTTRFRDYYQPEFNQSFTDSIGNWYFTSDELAHEGLTTLWGVPPTGDRTPRHLGSYANPDLLTPGTHGVYNNHLYFQAGPNEVRKVSADATINQRISGVSALDTRFFLPTTDQLLFSAIGEDATFGDYEIYQLTGNSTAASLYHAFRPGARSGAPTLIGREGDTAILTAVTPEEGLSVHRISPGSTSPQLIADVFPQTRNGGGDYWDLGSAVGKLFYNNLDQVRVVDSTAMGWHPVSPAGTVRQFAYLIGSTVDHALWRVSSDYFLTNGTPGHWEAIDLTPDNSRVLTIKFVAYRDKLYYTFLDNANGRDRWNLAELDPRNRQINTLISSPIPGNHPTSYSPPLVRKGDTFYFPWPSVDNRIEPHQYRIGEASPTLIAELPTSLGNSQHQAYRLAGDYLSLHFKRNENQAGLMLIQRINGQTTEIPAILTNNQQNLGLKILPAGVLVISNDGLYHLTPTGVNPTNLLPNIGENAYFYNYLDAGDRIYFSISSGNDPGLWRSDGTPEGTYKVAEVRTYLNQFSLAPSVAHLAGYSLFELNDPNFQGLYLLDNTTETLRPLPLAVPPRGGRPFEFHLTNRRIYFVINSLAYGREIHYLEFNLPRSLSGTVFEDLNENSAREQGEEGLYSQSVTISGEGLYLNAYTDEDGSYSFYGLPAGDYDLTVRQSNCWEAVTTSQSISLTADTLPIANLGLRALTGTPDLRANLTLPRIRCGFTQPAWITLVNNGCTPLSLSANLQIDPLVIFVSSDSTATINANQFSWDNITLAPGQTWQNRVILTLPDETFTGHPITFKLDAEGLTDTNLSLTDSITLVSELRCAIDPNDKLVSPARPESTSSNYTQIDEVLTYTIRFQNTGNDTAFNVRLEDQLSNSLDLSTFQPLAASHKHQVQLSDNGFLEVFFENIMLPDSNKNQVASNGFFSFTIQALPTTIGDTTSNTASIFFDFNQAIVTNTVKNTLVEHLDEDADGYFFWEDCNDQDPLFNPAAEDPPANNLDENCDGVDGTVGTTALQNTQFTITPNPTNEVVQIAYPTNQTFHYDLFDGRGRRMQSGVTSNGRTINLSPYPSGIYFLQLFDKVSGNRATKTIIKKQL